MKLTKRHYIAIGVLVVGGGVWGYRQLFSNDAVDDTNVSTGSVATSITIDTLDQDQLTREVYVKKSSQLTSSSTITISAQAPGRVQTIWVNPGDTVTQGRQLINLSDSSNAYYTAVQRASVGLEGAKLQYEQAQTQLDKSIDDAARSRLQAKQSYETLQKQREQQLAQAELNLQSITTNTDTSITTLQSQLFSLKTSLQSFSRSLQDHIDRIIGESIQYSSLADAYESSFIARGRQQLNQAKDDYRLIDNQLETLDEIDTGLSGEALIDTVDILKDIVQTQNTMLLNLQDLYQVALPSAAFTTQIQGQYQGEVASMLGQNQSQLNQIISYQDQVKKLTEENESGLTNADINKEQAELQYEATKTQLDDALAQAQRALEQARDAHEFAQRNKDIQLRLLQNSIRAAEVSYTDASRNAAKLSITAPLNGQIADVLVDKGQEVQPGTPLVSFIGTSENQIRITVDETQRDALLVGDAVQVRYGSVSYTGSITSIGAVADQTLSYPVTIAVPDNVTVIGGTVEVILPFQVEYPLVPLGVVRPRGRDRAMVSFWDGSQVIVQEVATGKTRGDMIELKLEDIPSNYRIITTDLTNYDPSRQEIEVNNTQKTDASSSGESLFIE